MINSRKPTISTQETVQAIKSSTASIHATVQHSSTHKPIDAQMPDAVQREIVLRQAWIEAWQAAHDQEADLSSYMPSKTANEEAIDALELSCVQTLQAIAALKAAH